MWRRIVGGSARPVDGVEMPATDPPAGPSPGVSTGFTAPTEDPGPVSAETLSELLEMGFPRPAAELALREAGGSIEGAVALLDAWQADDRF
mmetsp:Transcript_4665/g.10205  ORF Transcript_4665/g.10205 Transcript_4665/m.10205 type:complete len:91 (+) Transcript_4665:359-631(+)